MLEIRDLYARLGAAEVLRGVNLSAPKGAIVGLIGRNGAGKTTTLRAIMGLVKPSSGAITFDGQDLIAQPAHSRARLGIGYAPEDRRLIPDMSVEENLCVPAWATKADNVADRLERVYRIIPEAREWAPRRAMSLSGGQQKLVAVGRAAMSGERLLMLDEPFEGVAPALSKRIADVIGQLRQAGLAVILSGADLQHAGAVIDKVYKIDRGQMAA